MQMSPTPGPADTDRLARREFRLFAGTTDGPQVIVVSTVRRFRSLARELVRDGDSVLEIGCSSGETTRLLAQRAGKVLAVDVSPQFAERTARDLACLANVIVQRIDGRNVPSLVKLMPHPDLVFVDVGGSAQVDNAAFVARQCLLAFHPRALVIRNTEMAALLSLVERVEIPLAKDWPFAPMATGDEARMRLQNLLAVSRSDHPTSRVFAAKHLALYHEPEARRRIEELAADPQPRVRRTAESVLKRLDGGAGPEPGPSEPSLPSG